MQTVNSLTLFLCCGVIAVVYLNKKMEKENERDAVVHVRENQGESSRRAFWLLALYGFLVIRLIGFGQIPGGVNQDGAMGAVDAKALAMYGTDRFGTFMPAHFRAWGYAQMSVLLSYLTVPFIKIWGLNPFVMRLPMLIASLLGAGSIYGIVKKVFNEKTATVAFLFLAVNPWHFMQSRWALDCNLFPHMFVVAVYFLIKGIEKKINLFFSMVFFALCMYSYGVAFYMVPFFLLSSCILLFWQRRVKVSDICVCVIIYFGIAWPIYSTMLINFMKWETVELPFVTMEFFEESVRAADILFFSEHIGKQFLINIQALVNVVFLQKDDLPWNCVRGFGTMYRCAMPFIILGAALVIRRAFGGKADESDNYKMANDKAACQLLAFYWIFGLLTGVMINSVNVNRINIIFYIHIIFASVGISFVAARWKTAISIILAVFGIQSILFFHQYFTTWADEISDAFYEDFVNALEYAGEYNGDFYCITPDTQYEGAYNVTEILTLFTFDVDARYFQGESDYFQYKKIAYRDRFKYGNPDVIDTNTIYVFKSSDRNQFSDNEFHVMIFGDYGTAVPWFCYYNEWIPVWRRES